MRLSIKEKTLHVIGPALSGSEQKPSLLFVHGAGCNASLWESQAKHFVGKHPAFFLDLPGHGGSSPDGEKRISSYVQWVRLAASELFGSRPVVLVGHSMGGAVVLEMALEPPPGLAGIVLVGTGAKLAVTRAIFQMLREDVEAFYRTIGEFAFAAATPGEVRESFIREVRHCPPAVIQDDFMACNDFDIRSRLGDILLPALILCGAEDQLTPKRYSSHLKERIASSRLLIIPEAGHLVMLERPDVTNQAIESFLNEIRTGQ